LKKKSSISEGETPRRKENELRSVRRRGATYSYARSRRGSGGGKKFTGAKEEQKKRGGLPLGGRIGMARERVRAYNPNKSLLRNTH